MFLYCLGRLCGLCMGLMLFIGSVPIQAQENPASPTSLADEGDRQVAVGNYTQALALYNEAILRDPANAGFYARRARAYASLNELELALADYTVVIQLNPANASAYYERGLVYEQAGQPALALADYTAALEYAPSEAVIHLTLGNLYFTQGQLTEAVATYERYLQLVGVTADPAIVQRVQTLQNQLTPPTVASAPIEAAAPTATSQDTLLVVQPSVGGQQRGTPSLILQHDDLVLNAIKNQSATRLLSWSLDQTVRVWDMESGAQLLLLRHDQVVNGASWNRDETRILTWDASVQVWDAQTGALEMRLEHDAPIQKAAWNRDESRLLAWAGANAVYIWDVRTRTPLLKIEVTGRLLDVVWSPETDYILTSIVVQPTCQINCAIEMQVWDASTGVAILSFPGQSLANTAWNGQQVLAVVGNTIQVWATGNQPSPTAGAIPGANTDSLCTVSAAENVTKYSQASLTAVRFGTLYAAQNASVIGQQIGDDGVNWWRLEDGAWVRSDAVLTTGDCTDVPVLSQ